MGNVCIVIVTYNNEEEIESCLNSIFERTGLEKEVVVVDNNSKDRTVEIIKKFSDVKLLENDSNLGFGKGVNIGARETGSEFLAVLNPDTEVEEGWLKGLIGPLSEDRIVTTSMVVLKDYPNQVNTCGNHLHFTGLAFARGLGKRKEKFNKMVEVPGISGSSFAMRRKDWENLGGFGTEFFLYHEDTDLSWRANIQGYDVLLNGESVVRHDYSLQVSPLKLYYLERNRYLILRKYLSKGDLMKICPALLATEILAIGWALKNGIGGIKAKLKAIRDGLKFEVKGKTSDIKKILGFAEWKIPESQLSDSWVEKVVRKAANLVFEVNYKTLKGLF